jgi:hypothetical protein
MSERVIWYAKKLATGLERLLAFAILIGIIAFAFKSVVALIDMDWSSTETFYELIYRVLLLVIGVELIRTLVTHDLTAVLELLAFVVARKMLKPELATIDILLGVGAFVGCWLHVDSSWCRPPTNRHGRAKSTKPGNHVGKCAPESDFRYSRRTSPSSPCPISQGSSY